MHILFIYPDISVASGRFQQGLGSISSVLRKNGHKTSLLHIETELSKKQLCRKIESLNPNLIAFSTTTNQFPYVELYSKWIKESFKIPIVCGGVHPTLSPDDVISNENIDILCVGEGEYPMLELANKLENSQEITGIANLWVKADGKVYKNPLRPLISNIDELPFPDRELFDYEKMIRKFSSRSGNLRIAEVMTGRGCPFDCTYCCNHALRRIYHECGPYVRRRSVENVLGEIQYLIETYKINWLIFDDDTFTLDSRWLTEFCEKYPVRFNLPFQCNAFPTTLNKELVQKLKKAGCDRIAIGIESGNEWMRISVLRRPMTNEQIINAFKLLKEFNIKGYSFNIVGLPFETPEMLEDTVKLNLQVDPDHIQVSVFCPYPGTQLNEVCKENGFVTDCGTSSYFNEETSLNLPTLTRKTIASYYRKMHLISIDKIVSSSYPRIYPFYKLSKRVLGESLTYRITLLVRKRLYHY